MAHYTLPSLTYTSSSHWDQMLAYQIFYLNNKDNAFCIFQIMKQCSVMSKFIIIMTFYVAACFVQLACRQWTDRMSIKPTTIENAVVFFLLQIVLNQMSKTCTKHIEYSRFLSLLQQVIFGFSPVFPKYKLHCYYWGLLDQAG